MKIYFLILCFFLSLSCFSQDSLPTPPVPSADDESMFNLNGYLDSYYALYSDSLEIWRKYQKFSSTSPLNNTISLNLLHLLGSYEGNNTRAVFGLQYGDIADVNFIYPFNIIQQASAGVGIVNNLWFDAGIFPSHLGMEELLPKDNILSINSMNSYYLPKSQAGFKLSFDATEKLGFQIYLLNGYNMIRDNNKKKSVGFVTDYSPRENLNFYYSNYIGDDNWDQGTSHLFLINTFSVNYVFKERLTMVFGSDFGSKENSDVTGSEYAPFFNWLVNASYKIGQKFTLSSRWESFNDGNAVLSGFTYDKYIGLVSQGITFGLEFKPSDNSFLRFEARQLTADKKLKIYYTDAPTNVRREAVVSMGVWF